MSDYSLVEKIKSLQGKFESLSAQISDPELYPFIVPGSVYSNQLWDWDCWLTNIALRQFVKDDISEEEGKSFEDEIVKKAMYHYQEALKLNNNNFWSHVNLGSIYERFNNNEEALKHFSKAYEIDNTKEMVCYNLGVVYYKLKEYQKSLDFYKEELTKENPFKSTYYNLGILYKDGFQDYENAKYYYLKGLEINNEDYNIWYNLGCVHALLKDYKNAYECFKYIYYKNKKYLNYLDNDKELEEFRKTEYYNQLKQGL